jgi:hypothetical protein
VSGQVRLRNGDEVPEVLVRVTEISLIRLLEREPIAFWELVLACRDRDHVLFGSAVAALHDLSLIERVDGQGRAQIHDCTRSIVLAATEGEGFGIGLRNPRPEVTP